MGKLFSISIFILIGGKIKKRQISVTIPAKFGSKWQNGFNEENNSRQRGRTPSHGNISPFDEMKTTFHSLSYRFAC
jgi:hypothetical protein